MKTKSARLSRMLVASVLLASFPACGYYSTASRTAKDIKSIYVPFFDNVTSEPGLELTVTEQIIDELINDNTLKVTSEDQADALLRGEIASFENRPFSFNQDLGAEEYRVRIGVKASLIKQATSEPIWENQVIQGTATYFLESVDGENSLDEAITQAIRDITNKIINMTVQDW